MTDRSSDELDDEPLHEAALRGDAVAIRMLLAGGMDPNVQDDLGDTALVVAARDGHIEAAKALLVGGVDVNAASWRGATALQEAVERRNVEMITVLLKAGASPMARGSWMRSSLDIAREMKRPPGPRILAMLEEAVTNQARAGVGYSGNAGVDPGKRQQQRKRDERATNRKARRVESKNNR